MSPDILGTNRPYGFPELSWSVLVAQVTTRLGRTDPFGLLLRKMYCDRSLIDRLFSL
ncbi:MAG: hypothetical protein ACXAB7_18700 [Candidatus Kariarchaeaceae archaeon]